MIRCRFYVPNEDPRPIHWPIKHPYWVTGSDMAGRSVLVAYADDEAEIMRHWPDAQDLDSAAADNYAFTDRFKKPEWLQLPTSEK
jgi:hypothetical protein